MATKLTAFFELGTIYGNGVTYRVAGWSESWINMGGGFNNSSFDKQVSDLLDARAKILAKQGSIVAYRYQTVVPDGRPTRSQVYLANRVGNADYPTDIPNMAFAYRGYSSGQNMRIMELRGFPDSQVVTGEAARDPNMVRNMNAFTKKLVDDGWGFRGIQKDVQTVDINLIGSVGAVSTVDDFACPPVGKKVQILRTKESPEGDDQFGGIFKVLSITDARHFTLQGWDNGDTKDGRVRSYAHDFFPFNFFSEQAVYTRKVGRPFFQYRGRASNKA
jgi:hypothetical protein